MTLGIVVALSGEAEPLSQQRLPPNEVIRLNENVQLFISGMGAQAAQQAGQALLKQGAQALLSWGTAVALKPGINPGQLLIPGNVMTADQTPVSVSQDWHTLLIEHFKDSFSVCTEPLIATDEILYTATRKQAVRIQSGAVAADMESAAIGLLARKNGVKFAAIRVIIDNASMRLPAWLPACIDAYGRVRPAQFISSLLLHPHDWFALFKLARGFGTAQAKLKSMVQATSLDGLAPH